MRKISSILTTALALGLTTVTYLKLHNNGASHSTRVPASRKNTDSPNIKLLKAIPPVPGVESPSPDETEWTEQLVDLFDRFADRNRNSDLTLNRGTHAKGKCFKGELTLYSAEELKERFSYSNELITVLKQGLFSLSATLPTHVRFANADGVGRKQADTVADVRGFSFSVQTPETFPADYTGGHRQDFMMNSTPAFATGEIHGFLELVKAANIAIYHDFTYIPNLGYISSIADALTLLNAGNAAGGKLMSFAATEYWDNLPYTHGPANIAKFKATPCDGKGTQHLTSVDGLDPDYLQNEIVIRANEESICFNIQTQLYDLNTLRSTGHADWSTQQWIENGGLLWDESLLPFHTVAQLRIPQQTSASREVSCTDKYINTRLHAVATQLPVGSIARVRTIVEEISRERRSAQPK